MAVTLAPWNAVLRDWQTRAVADVLANPAEDYLVTATPAAGKTRFALRIAHHYLAARAAGRVVVVCPTNHLRTQWASAAGQVGIQLDPALSNDQAFEARDYHGAVVTYHQQLNRIGYNDIQGPFLSVVEERRRDPQGGEL